MPTFNLLDEGWIPCLRSTSDPPELLSIRQVLHLAPTLRQIADPAPPVTAMLHRLLLAILHRSINGPQTTNEWAAIWRAGLWDVTQMDAYLDRVHDRFDLFDATHPFYQITGLAEKSFKEINHLTHERASDRSKPLLFDHSLPGAGMSADTAARYLIAQQGFSVGGLFTTDPNDPPGTKYASASPLLKSAVCLVMGKTLFETLMLNWHQYNPSAEVPFPFSGDDKPAWERDEPVAPTERRPDGWVDLLTWQSRRIALQPVVRSDGNVRVTHAALLKGYGLPDAFDLHQSETMVAYTLLKNPRQSDSAPWIPVSLNLGKAAWRDSHALFQSFGGDHQRPRTLEWLRTLMAEGALSMPKVIPLGVFGIIPDQAKVDDWRHETLALPELCIETPAMVDVVRRELEFAEHIADLLEPRILKLTTQVKEQAVRGPSPVRILAEELLRATSDRNADPRAIADLGRHLSPIESYWSALESPFRSFIIGLADDVRVDAFGDLTERGDAARAWAEAINRIAHTCFDAMCNGLEGSGRAHRAAALARARFDQFMHRLNAAHDALLPHAQLPL